MSEDEVLVTVVGLAFGPILWAYLLVRMSAVRSQQRRPGQLLPLIVALLLATAIIVIVLNTLASFDVVGAIEYQVMYTLLGLAWLRGAASMFPLAGLSLRDDVIERRNPAATLACAGALLGVACCYAGGNVGDGPGWWVVVFCALLSTGTLFVAWIALAQLSPVADSVAIDRDPAAGLRVGAFLVASGLMLGRATAGDWIDQASAIADVARFLPAVILLAAIAVWVERTARPTPQRPRAEMVTWGALPSMVYLAVAIAALVVIGAPA